MKYLMKADARLTEATKNVFGDVVGIATGVSQGEAGAPGTFVALSDFMNVLSGVKGTSTPAVAE